MKFGKKYVILAGILAWILFTGVCEGESYNLENKPAIEFGTSNYTINSEAVKSENGLLTYKINDVNLLDGKTEIYLSITNNGDFDTTLDAITIRACW